MLPASSSSSGYGGCHWQRLTKDRASNHSPPRESAELRAVVQAHPEPVAVSSGDVGVLVQTHRETLVREVRKDRRDGGRVHRHV